MKIFRSMAILIIAVGCFTTQYVYADSFKLRSSGDGALYGPFEYANETEVIIDETSYYLIISDNSFSLKSIRERQTYGPFAMK